MTERVRILLTTVGDCKMRADRQPTGGFAVQDIANKVAVVTGGANGIGRGIVEALLEADARVVIADVEQPVLEATVAELAGRGDVLGVRTDVSDPARVEALAATVFDRTAPATCSSTTPESRRAVEVSRGSRSPTTGAGASASTSSASPTGCTRSCPA